jgi:hypothetical protein
LAGAFEEHLSRSLSEIDRSLKIIRTLQARDAGKFKLADWLKSNRVLTNEVLQIALVDREANVKVGGAEGEAQTLSQLLVWAKPIKLTSTRLKIAFL